MLKKSISIVIPNFNGAKLLANNLPRVIKALNNKANNIVEIVVVDDGSDDDSLKVLRDDFPKVKVIKHKANMGFVASVNRGVAASKGELVALLNNDVAPSYDFLAEMQENFKDKRVFGVSLNERGYSWTKGVFKNGFVVYEPGKKSKNIHATFWVSGGSSVIRKSYWKKLRGFDEELLSPFYWEDIDISYRAQKRGYKVLWDPRAKVVHKHESTVSTLSKSHVSDIQQRNQLLFIWKNITSTKMIREHVKGLFQRMIKHPGYTRIVLLALYKFTVVLKKRKIEKKQSTATDEQIFAKV